MELPIKGCLGVRITDNVLDDDDWGVDHIILRDGKVVKQCTSTEGVYRIPNMVGWEREQIVEWSKHDDTGRHPEQYHEIEVCM